MTILIQPNPKKPNQSVDLTGSLSLLNAECRNCKPVTPFECLSNCRVYLLKSELRHLWEAMANPRYTKELFNALKSKPRLLIMQAIINGFSSEADLQDQLRKHGYSFSSELLCEESLRPLLAVGLVRTKGDRYYVTTLGTRLIKQLDDFEKFAGKLPSRSECYEEALLQSLLSGPKTFQEISVDIAPKNVSRTLRRLRLASFIKTRKSRAYIFFFKTIRDPNREQLTKTERRVYDAVAAFDGICADQLVAQTGLCLRRTYKYIRHLRGKKLVFFRRNPKTYELTCKGKKVAIVLQKFEDVALGMWSSSQGVMRDNQSILQAGGLIENVQLR